jgi:hypothetical protein
MLLILNDIFEILIAHSRLEILRLIAKIGLSYWSIVPGVGKRLGKLFAGVIGQRRFA